MSTALPSSVFLLSYRNTVLYQSARVFALGHFLKEYNIIFHQESLPTLELNLNTVEPSLNGHPRINRLWLLKRGLAT